MYIGDSICWHAYLGAVWLGLHIWLRVYFLPKKLSNQARETNLFAYGLFLSNKTISKRTKRTLHACWIVS